MSFTRILTIFVLPALTAFSGASRLVYSAQGAEKPSARIVREKEDNVVLMAANRDPFDKEDHVTLASMPPVVIKTVPEAGTEAVDPSLSEIKVTFSKDMADGSWSWSTLSKESFPKWHGKPKYLPDKRTCVLPVRLESGKTYAIWVNSQKFRDFKDTQGRSAVPYLLVFKTKK